MVVKRMGGGSGRKKPGKPTRGTLKTRARTERRALIKKYEAFRRRVQRRVRPAQALASWRKTRPLTRRLSVIGRRLSSRRNYNELVKLIKLVVPPKGQRKAKLIGRPARTAVEKFLKKMRINLGSLEKTARRVGVRSTFKLGVSGEAALQLGVQGSAGIAWTHRRREFRWYLSSGGTMPILIDNIGAGGAVEIGYEKGGPENQRGKYVGIQLGVGLGKRVSGSIETDEAGKISGGALGYGVGGNIKAPITLNYAVGYGWTRAFVRW